MKKIICSILCVCMLSACLLAWAEPMRTDASYAMPDLLDGVNNIDLAYMFLPSGTNYGRQTVESFLPHVGYRTKTGQYTDIFMDSFLFLPCVTKAPSGGTIYRSDNPAIASDWEKYVSEVFETGYNLDALNSAAEIIGKELKKTDLRVNVFLTVLYPQKGQTNFGKLGGETLNFNSLADRKKAVRWMVDEQLRRFSSAQRQHLKMCGFYWFEENLLTNDSQEKELVTYFNEYVHSLGFKTIWIPYYRASGWSRWKEYGFDVACMQPNLMWMAQYDGNRVASCINDISRNGMCMEMEMDDSVFGDRYEYYMDYLREGLNSGVSQAIKMYYEGGAPGTLYSACRSLDPLARSVYDLTYKYASNTLTPEDLVPQEEYCVPKGYREVSIGKPYTATAAYTGNGSAGYQDIDGKELTDGILSAGIFTTAWHGFHVSNQEPGGGYAITVDLGSVMQDIGYFSLRFGGEPSASIGLPTGISFWISTDGKNFKKVGSAPDQPVNPGIFLYECRAKGVPARYVRATFDRKSTGQNFLFCSEFLIGQRTALPGDADGDGMLTSYDAVLLVQYFAGLTELPEVCADADEDGTVSMYDSIVLLKKLSGLGA